MRAFVFALLVLFAACAPAAPHIAVAPGFSADEYAQIVRAAETWNQVTRADHRITLDGGDWSLLHEDPPGRVEHGWEGETNGGQRTIWIWPGIRPDLFYRVVLHELGHALGLMHIAGFAVMSPSAAADYLTELDLEECRRAGACE